jgi:hypothetical protein
VAAGPGPGIFGVDIRAPHPSSHRACARFGVLVLMQCMDDAGRRNQRDRTARPDAPVHGQLGVLGVPRVVRTYCPEGFGIASFKPNVGTGRAAASPLSATPGIPFAAANEPAIASTPP